MRLLRRLAQGLVVLFCVLYGGDYLSLRLRIPGHREQFGTVEVERFLAVRLKNRKTEYMPDEPLTRTCVHSLFPHFEDPPCWYLERHRREEIQIGQ